MRYCFLLLITFISLNVVSQTKGFEFLASSKSSMESLIKTYASSIPDTSATFKKFYLPLSKQYNAAKSTYNGYRGGMKDCILNNESKKKIQQCLQSKSATISKELDSLQNILERAYWDAYANKTLKELKPVYTGTNTGFFTGDLVKAILDSLLNGTLKLWDQTKKYRKEYKENYLNNISSKEYDLSDLDDILKMKPPVPGKQ